MKKNTNGFGTSQISENDNKSHEIDIKSHETDIKSQENDIESQATERNSFVNIATTPEQQEDVALAAAAALTASLPKKKAIGEKEINDAYAILDKYRRDSQALRNRIIENQLYYEHTCTSGRARNQIGCKKFRRSTSAYLFNSIANKHADFMDNMPSPTILPQEESDTETAKVLSDVLPSIFDSNRYQKVYSKACFDKLVGGASVYAVTWDGSADNGLGKIRVSNAEILNLYWEGGISNLEESPNLFYVSIANNKDLETRYPELSDALGHSVAIDIDKFVVEDEPDRTNQTAVIDWYYRRPTVMENATGERVVKNVLHFCKFAAGKVLFASENEVDPETGEALYPDGYYEHGRYPYLMDTLFPIKGSPAGFGYVDVMKNPQEYIDELDTAVLDNAKWAASPHWLVPVGAGINTKDIEDGKTFIEVSALTDQIKLMDVPGINSNILNIRNLKTEELKETSGNTDFSQGTTAAGVTAASAIAALQEAGSKLSRDMIKNTYEVYSDMCAITIELIRQFYTVERVYRITKPNEEYAFERISSRMLGGGTRGETMFGMAVGDRKPYFDIKIDAQKASPFSKAAQNELALQLYSNGMFNPEIADQALVAVEMMQFEGKDTVQQKVSQNGQLLQENTQLRQYVVQLAQQLAQTGDAQTVALAQAIAQKYGVVQEANTNGMPSTFTTGQIETDNLGNAQSTESKTARVRKQVQDRTEVR